jgi:hypothetical protein
VQVLGFGAGGIQHIVAFLDASLFPRFGLPAVLAADQTVADPTP